MHAIAHDGSNAIPPHLAGRVGNDLALVVEQHPEPTVRQNLVDNTFDRKQLFFAGVPLSGQLVASWR